MTEFKHSGQLGDIIYAIPAMRRIAEQRGDPALAIYVPNDRKANHAPGLKHVSGELMMTRAMFDFVRPLLAQQPGVEALHFVDSASIPRNAIDLDVIRNGTLNLSAGNIRDYYFKAFGLVADETAAAPWLERSTQPAAAVYDVVFGRSTRYLNDSIDYTVLLAYAGSVGFIGTAHEYKNLRERYPDLAVDHVHVSDAMQACNLIAASRLYVGNQSLFFAIAEGLRADRALEVFEPVPNVVPYGGRCAQFVSSAGLCDVLRVFLGEPAVVPKPSREAPHYVLSRP